MAKDISQALADYNLAKDTKAKVAAWSHYVEIAAFTEYELTMSAVLERVTNTAKSKAFAKLAKDQAWARYVFLSGGGSSGQQS